MERNAKLKMGHRMELYVNSNVAEEIVNLKSFNAKVIVELNLVILKNLQLDPNMEHSNISIYIRIL